MFELNIVKKEEKTTCILCGDDLNKMGKAIQEKCDYCGRITDVTHQCNSYHYICNDCLTLAPFDFIKKKCLDYNGLDAIELAVSIMNSPTIRMHGPEHHFIVPAVLLTVVSNYRNDKNSLSNQLDIAYRRAINESPQYCEYHNNYCGAAIGSGIFLSIFSNEDTENENEWSLTNPQIAQSLKRVADSGGPRCCKRDTYISIQSSIDYLAEKFAIELPKSDAKCTFSLRNRSCKREDCEYFNLSNDMV